MNRAIKEVDFVIFDVETTGLSPGAGHRICEIAALKLTGTKETARFNSLVNPGIPMPAEVYEIHHISDAMLAKAPKNTTILPDFLKFIEGSVIAGYNVGFDLAFLENELATLKKKLDPETPVIDILKMSRRLLPGQASYSLANISKALRIDVPQVHRAMQDVELTTRVFELLLEKLDDHAGIDFSAMHSLFGLNGGLIVQANAKKIAEITRAIEMKARLKITYFTSYTAAVTEREITPKEVKQENDRTYLVGFCHMRGEERNFRIDSIIDIQYST